jgi:uncharacterized NAD(P)/FAD-binding protein YdhS
MARTIIIIGGGCAGTLVAAQLLRQATGECLVRLIERSGAAGRGIAYGTNCNEHLLNVPAAKMSAWPDDPEHFLRWAQARAGQLGFPDEIGGADFLPRQMFGQYLAQVLDEARSAAAPGRRLEVIGGEAIELDDTGAGGKVTLADGRTFAAERVVLALGNLTGEYPIRRPLPFYRSPRYVHQPWLPGALQRIGKKEAILLVGAGLTAVDMVIQCRRAGHTGVIHALSRRGLRPLSHVQGLRPYPAFLTAGNLPATVREAVRRVRHEVRRGFEQGYDWRAVTDSLRPFTPAIWQNWSVEDRARFMRYVRPFWENHRHRLAPAVAALIEESAQAGRLKFYAGRLVSLVEAEGAAQAQIQIRGRSGLLSMRIAKVINCTGPRTDYSKYQHPLLIHLLAAGLIGHDPLALGIDALPSGEVLRDGGEPTGWLFTLGAPLKGTLWESTAVPEIRAQAAQLAARLLAG